MSDPDLDYDTTDDTGTRRMAVEEGYVEQFDENDPRAQKAVYPVLDGAGGTDFVYGKDEEGATAEEWAAQNGASVPPQEEDVLEEDEAEEDDLV